MNYFSVNKKVAIVTGGSSGIGFGLSQAFVKAGATVVIVNRNKEKGKAAKEALQKSCGEAIAIPADVTKRSSVKDMMKAVVDQYGKVDILVNAAGVIMRRLAVDMSNEEWNQQIDINLKGTFNCCVEAARYMIEKRWGRMINISSNAAMKVGVHTPAAYAAAKAGIVQMSRALAIEWIPYNINVNIIAPGFFETPMNEEFRMKHVEEYEKIKRHIPQGRVGRVMEDLGGVAIFLASTACQHMVGQVIFVDGGDTVGDGRWDISEGRIAGS